MMKRKVKKFAGNEDSVVESDFKKKGLESSNKDDRVGFFERLRMGNIDDPKSEAYKRFGAGRGRTDADKAEVTEGKSDVKFSNNSSSGKSSSGESDYASRMQYQDISSPYLISGPRANKANDANDANDANKQGKDAISNNSGTSNKSDIKNFINYIPKSDAGNSDYASAARTNNPEAARKAVLVEPKPAVLVESKPVKKNKTSDGSSSAAAKPLPGKKEKEKEPTPYKDVVKSKDAGSQSFAPPKKEPPLRKVGKAIKGTLENANKPFRSSMYDKMKGRKDGGSIKMAKGGSASARADGIAIRGKTRA